MKAIGIEINPWEKYPVRVLDPESSEAKSLMAGFDEESQEPKRFAELSCRSMPAKSPTEEEIRAVGFDPKTMPRPNQTDAFKIGIHVPAGDFGRI
ncbi:MAG: hypothetical protein ACRCXD_03060 [Luteolibacter sp.]